MNALKLFAASTLTALAALSCAMQEEVEGPQAAPATLTRIHFSATSPETRTVFGEGVVDGSSTRYPTLWTANDTEVAVSLNLGTPVLAAVIPTESGKGADFDAEIDVSGIAAPYTFHVLSPASALEGVSESRNALTLSIPADQTALPGSVDESAMILVARSEALQAIPEQLSVSFFHLTAYGKLTLKNLPSGIAVSAVTLVSEEQAIAGSWYYHVEDGTLEAREPSSSVQVRTDASGPVWFSLAPVDLGGKKLKVIVTADAGTYEREIVLKSTVNLSPGQIYGFSVNMENATFTENVKEEYYERVTDASALQDGDEVIIATPQYSYAMSTSQSTNNRGRTSVTIDNDRIYDPASTVEILTLESSSGSWYLRTSTNQYLYTTSSTSSQRLRTGTKNQSSVFNQWTITVSNGNASISAKVSNTATKYLVYNNSSSVFTVATSAPGTGNNRVALYRKVQGGHVPAVEDPILEQETYGAYLASGEKIYVPGTCQLSREYHTDGTLTFAILTQAEYTIWEYQGVPTGAAFGTAFTLTYTERRGKSVISSTEFPVTVVREQGSKLWLSDGSGNGFIVKR